MMYIKYSAYIIAALVIAYLLLMAFTKPSLFRNWSADQKVLASAEFEGNRVTIKNIRNIVYRSVSDYDVSYYDKTFDIDSIESAWYMVEPFSGSGFGAAHTLLSFGFANGSYVAISAEIRKEVGETFSPFKGLLRQYELVYVIADERDVIKLRTNYRKDTVFLYPVIADKEEIKDMFISMLNRANQLHSNPEFYNTLTNNCTTTIADHFNEVSDRKIPWNFRLVMPAYSDLYAQKLGLIDPTLSSDQLRATYTINEKALEYADDPEFSKRIRGK